MRSLLEAVTDLLGRFRLWQQFVMLGLFIVVVPISSTSMKFLSDGQAILTEHEIIDLSDESNLRVNEFREEVNRLWRDVAQEAEEIRLRCGAQSAFDAGANYEASLSSFLTNFPIRLLTPGSTPTDIGQVRRRYFENCLLWAGVMATDGSRWGLRLDAEGKRLAETSVNPTMQAVAKDLAARLGRPSSIERAYVSGLHLHPEGACYFAVAAPIRWADRRPTEVLLLMLDFRQYIRNRARLSPRHQYIVTNARGQLLVHPDSSRVEARAQFQDLTSWTIPSYAWEGVHESSTDRNRRQAKMIREGGVRLAGVEVPALRHFYTKGYFGGEMSILLGNQAAERLAELNGQLDKLSLDDARFRFGEVGTNASYIELSHPEAKQLETIQVLVSQWWEKVRGQTGTEVDWSRPLDCRTFQGQLTHLRLDDSDDEPPRLVVAASLEELRQDINTRFTRTVYRWVIPTVAISILFTVGLIFLLTNSLQRLARTAKTAQQPSDFESLCSGSSVEVKELQTALRGLAERLNDDAARYSTILRTAGEGIIVTSVSGVIEVANRAAGEMFGRDRPDSLLGHNVQSLLADPLPLDQARSDSTLDGSKLSQANREVLRAKRLDGSFFWVEATTRPVTLKDRTLLTCVFRDITQRRAQEEQIRQMNEELELRVKLRTAELAEANAKLEVALQQAEAASKAKDAFVANMSHELRQPLHIIIGFTEALKEEAEDAERTDLIPDLNKILTAAKHLLDLINDILDLAKIAAGRMDLSISRFSVAMMLNEVRTLVMPLAERNQNQFELQVEPTLGEMNADERRVRQMLINLLSNAFKFTNQGRVVLQVSREQHDGRDWIRFRVQDTGRGMTAEQVSRLFQRFYQADASTTREAGGTGLGLAITQSFNELMKGQPIEVTSSPGQGSTFTLRLPGDVNAAEPLAPTPPRILTSRTLMPDQTSLPQSGGTILVIDDDAAVQELMTRFLTKEGFHVVTASTGPEGLRLAAELKPDAITLDVMMPGTDGWAVLSSLKLNAETCDIPVVMLTIVDDRGRGFALGAADYLTKPIDWQRLGAILKRYLPTDRKSPVLVIDDDPECRDIVTRYLQREGWRIRTAENGEDGLQAYAQEPPALILLDLMMPQLDGFGFLDQLAKRFPTAKTPVIILTAKDLTAEDFDRLNGRVAKILEKNQLSQLDELLKLVRRHARHREGQDDEAADRR